MKRRIFGLDLARAAAILCVLGAHTIILFNEYSPAIFKIHFWFGFLGVEIFFVLSGLLVGRILIESLAADPSFRTVGRFWLRRWFRTLPGYYVFLAIYVFLYPPAIRPRVGPLLVFMQNFTHWRTGSLFEVSWSLAIEEWFYFLFPLVLLPLWRLVRRPGHAIWACILLFGAFSSTARALLANDSSGWDYGVRKIVVFRFDSLMFGVAGAYCSLYFPTRWLAWRGRALALGTVALAVCGVVFFTIDLDRSIFARTALFPLCSFAVLGFLPSLDAWKTGPRAVAKPITALSLWSYAIYLSHIALLIAVRRIREGLDLRGLLIFVVPYLVITIGVSYLIYAYFEAPTTRLRDRFA